MSDMILGTVKAGQRLEIQLGAFTGTAGVRRIPEGLEVAFMGVKPGTSLPIDGVIAGQRVRAVAKREASIEKMNVYVVEMVD